MIFGGEAFVDLIGEISLMKDLTAPWFQICLAVRVIRLEIVRSNVDKTIISVGTWSFSRSSTMSSTSSFFQSVRSQRAVPEVCLFQSTIPNDLRERVDIAFADVKEPH